MSLYAGVCRTDITPPPGVWMCGYAFRNTGAVGVHDPLNATAIVFDNGDRRVGIVSTDLIALSIELVASIREKVQAAIGIAPEALMLHCTHTHGGPNVAPLNAMGEYDPAYMSVLERKIVGAFVQASRSMLPVRLSAGEAPVQIGINRRQTLRNGETIIGENYCGLVDPVVRTLSVNQLSGQPLAVLMHHACHPTTMEGDNMLFTSDWPGAAVNRLEARFREDRDQSLVVIGMLLNGCCGDINPNPRGTWQDVERAGNLVGDAAYGARWSSHGTLDDRLLAEEIELQLPLIPPPNTQVCAEEISKWEKTLAEDIASVAPQGKILFDQAHLDWHKFALTKADSSEPILKPFKIQHLNLGGAHLLGFPAEMFVEYQQCFSSLIHAPLFALSYTNGCYGYMPTASEHVRGGYEVNEANKYYGALAFAPECDEMIREAVERMVVG